MNNIEQPSFHILICLIEIWKPKDDEKHVDLLTPTRDADLMISEVESLEISNSFSSVIGSANILFPRGTILKRTIDKSNAEEAGNEVSASFSSEGVLLEERSTKTEIATPNHFVAGSRIRIRLGYTTDPAVYRKTKINTTKPSIYTDKGVYNDYIGHLTTMFEGFITRCSIDSPISIYCEDLAYVLKCTSCKPVTTTTKTTVQELLLPKGDEKGKHGLLEKSGLTLHPGSEEIKIGKSTITTDYTVFDILDSWHKWNVFAYLDWNDGKPCISVRRAYFHAVDKNSLVWPSRAVNKIVDFQYNVATNNLKLVNTDKKFLAVRAKSMNSDGRQTTTLTIIPNPEWTEGGAEKEQWRVVNETKISARMMKKHHIKMISEGSTKVSLKEYTIIDYMSKNIGLTHEQLLTEAIQFWSAYNKNGIEGSLVLFGDLAIKSTDIVELYDKRFPQKNGKYFVEEVQTTFGTRGYRQTITLPYCLQRNTTTQSSDNATSSQSSITLSEFVANNGQI